MDSPPKNAWPPGVEALLGDIRDMSAVHAAMRGVHSVVHMAALLHIVNPPANLRDKYEAINIGGTQNVVAAALQSGVKRIVYFSTIAVYGPSRGKILTEETQPNPDTFYSRTKLAGERIILEAQAEDGMKIGTVLRFGAVYGARIKGNYQRLVRSLSRGLFVPVGEGYNRRTLVYDKDVARAALLALEHPNSPGKIFNVSDGGYHTLNEIISAICLALGRRPPVVSIPAGLARFSAGMIEDLSYLAGIKPPILRASIDKYTEDVAVDGRRIQNELGFTPEFDLLSGWKDAVNEMRKMGYLNS